MMTQERIKGNGTSRHAVIGVDVDKVLQINPLAAIVMTPEGEQITMSAEVVVVTPQMATAWVEGKKHNRKSSDRRIGSYARDMAKGKWRVTNQGLAFDLQGHLIDGEHRLRAVIESDVPTAFLIVRGLPSATQNSIDSGRIRSVADQYGMTTQAERPRERVALGRILRLIANGWKSETEIPTFDEQCETIRKYQSEIEWAVHAFSRRRNNFTPATVVGAWAYAYGAAPEVSEWVDSYIDGAGLERRDPLLMLRSHMGLGTNRASAVRQSVTLRTLRALHAKMCGQKLSKLYDSADGVVAFGKMRGDEVAPEWLKWRVRG